MHLTKALFVAFAAVGATVSAASSGAEKRQSAECDNALASLGTARDAAAAAGGSLTGSAQVCLHELKREKHCASTFLYILLTPRL
jgi:hypothetical protein